MSAYPAVSQTRVQRQSGERHCCSKDAAHDTCGGHGARRIGCVRIYHVDLSRELGQVSLLVMIREDSKSLTNESVRPAPAKPVNMMGTIQCTLY